jgi:glutathione S-transferase
VYFERTLAGNRKGSGYILGRTLSYADLSIFQLIAGLRYAIPKAALGTEVSQAGAAAR